MNLTTWDRYERTLKALPNDEHDEAIELLLTLSCRYLPLPLTLCLQGCKIESRINLLGKLQEFLKINSSDCLEFRDPDIQSFVKAYAHREKHASLLLTKRPWEEVTSALTSVYGENYEKKNIIGSRLLARKCLLTLIEAKRKPEVWEALRSYASEISEPHDPVEAFEFTDDEPDDVLDTIIDSGTIAPDGAFDLDMDDDFEILSSETTLMNEEAEKFHQRLADLKKEEQLMIWQDINEVKALEYAVLFFIYHLEETSVHPLSVDARDLIRLLYRAVGDDFLYDRWRATRELLPATQHDPFLKHDGVPGTLLELLCSVGIADLIIDPTYNSQSLLKTPFPEPQGLVRDDTTYLERLWFHIAKSNNLSTFNALKVRVGHPPRQPKFYSSLSRAILGGNDLVITELLNEGVDPAWPSEKACLSGRQFCLPNQSYFDYDEVYSYDVSKFVGSFCYPGYRVIQAGTKLVLGRSGGKSKSVPLSPLSASIRMNSFQAIDCLQRFGLTADWDALLDRLLQREWDDNRQIIRFLIPHCHSHIWSSSADRQRRMFLILKSICSQRDLEDMVKLLLDLGADPNGEPRDEKGNFATTSLEDAMRKLYNNTIIEARDVTNQMRSQVIRYGQVVRMLFEAGAKVDRYTRSFCKSRHHLRIIIEGFEAGNSWEEILATLDKEYLDESWDIVNEDDYEVNDQVE